VLGDISSLGVAVTLDEAGKMRVRTPRGISPALVGPVVERHGDLMKRTSERRSQTNAEFNGR
jgi:hypothetical protein